jgi:hypothetical protein
VQGRPSQGVVVGGVEAGVKGWRVLALREGLWEGWRVLVVREGLWEGWRHTTFGV